MTGDTESSRECAVAVLGGAGANITSMRGSAMEVANLGGPGADSGTGAGSRVNVGTGADSGAGSGTNSKSRGSSGTDSGHGADSETDYVDRDGRQHIARDDDHCVRTSSHVSTRTGKVQ